MENQKTKKNNLTLTYTLPSELIVEILLRLPVRSLLRFKCVCKLWLSLISDPQFAKSHFDLAAPSYRLLLKSTNRSIRSLDIEASLRDDSAIVNLLLPPPPPSTPSYREDSNEDVDILGSCRGLIILQYRRGDLMLWNPSIGVYKRISHPPYVTIYPIPYLRHLGYYGFGYDMLTGDYLVVFILLNFDQKSQILIFSLKTNSWNYEDINFQYKFLPFEFRAGSPLNGALHWLVSSEDKRNRIIIGFDLRARTFFEIPLPRDLTLESKYGLAHLYPRNPRLRVMGGCLALCHPGAGKGDEIEIWVMKEYRVQSSWNKFISLSTCRDIPPNSFFPMCFTKGGGIFGTHGHRRLVKLDDKGQLLEDFINDYPAFGAVGAGLYRDNLHSAMYRESLLSLPPDFGEARPDD